MPVKWLPGFAHMRVRYPSNLFYSHRRGEQIYFDILGNYNPKVSSWTMTKSVLLFNSCFFELSYE